MFRKPKAIVFAAVAFYVVALLVIWHEFDRVAERRTVTMLTAAERGYSDVIDGEIDAALRNVAGAFINVIGGKCRPLSLERMQDLAKTFNLDEVNIVDRNGIVIGSNLSRVLGFDFKTDPRTREFMVLTNANKSILSQPFRHGVANPEMFCRYHGVAFPERDGFLQLGMSVTGLRQNMYSYSEEEADRLLKDWHFSVVGWYERADHDPDFAEGKIFRRWNDEHGEMCIGRYFDYRGFRYVAFLPQSYCYSQRNNSFVAAAMVLGVLLFFFVYMLVRLANASAKLEKMHAAADARTAADLALARTIQMSALPSADSAFMERMEFSLVAACNPAREVGGDFYDFFQLPSGALAFLVADASGKGVPGAMFMMEAKNVLKHCLEAFADVVEAVTEANLRLCAGNRAEMFVTAWIGVVDKDGTCEYVNAGHNRPFVRRANGEVEKIVGKGGRFLGMFEDAAYRVHSFKLDQGDLLYLYTDGVTEAMNAKGEQFGEQRLRAALAVSPGEVRRSLSAFVGEVEPSDDVTDLALSWNGMPACESRVFSVADEALGPAVDFIRMALSGVPAKDLAAILNVADEIMANIVGYSLADEFTVTVERGIDRVRMDFSDGGTPYNPLSHLDPDTHAPIEKRPVGGLGLVMVKRLSDRVMYVREGGRNVLTVIRRFRSS